MTNGEMVSRVVNAVRALNKDEHISKRHILWTARTKSELLLSQKLMDMTLFRDESLISTIKCFELEPDNVIKCDAVELRRCKSVMKSKEKLPKLIYSRYGNSIVCVQPIDGGSELDAVSKKSFQTSQRKYADAVDTTGYYVSGGYLYLTDTETQLVDIDLITLETDKVDELSACEDCDGNCDSIWDQEFVSTDKLEEIVIQQTLQEVLGSWRQIPEDENPNLDSNQKSQTVN